MGDFNCNLASPQPNNNNTASLTNNVDIYNLHQLLNSSTCIANTSSILTDFVFTICLNNIASAGVSNVGLSGHSLTYAFRKISSNSTMTYRKFGNFGSTRFCYNTSTKDWDRVNSYDDPNVMWNIWKIFFQCIDKHTPQCTKCIWASKSPWITPQLKKRMHCKDVLKVKAICSGTRHSLRAGTSSSILFCCY